MQEANIILFIKHNIGRPEFDLRPGLTPMSLSVFSGNYRNPPMTLMFLHYHNNITPADPHRAYLLLRDSDRAVVNR